ncbi:hypothetical protein [Methylomonas sp. MK1]|uniref:hypothetical protein n=1 Tax=Methylomonas sp. MK1 TaxID=1131552 RepID=UPI00037C8AD8|nr:hypothetical protein [Methylomonas sp. MK1]
MSLVKTPEWWISVVFVGIVINLFSTLALAFMQRKYAYLVTRWAERNEKLAKLRNERIHSLANSDHDLVLACINLNKIRLDSIFEFVLAILMLTYALSARDSSPISYAVCSIGALLSLMQGMLSTIKYGQELLLLTEAKLLSDRIKSKDSMIAAE